MTRKSLYMFSTDVIVQIFLIHGVNPWMWNQWVGRADPTYSFAVLVMEPRASCVLGKL